METFDIKYKAQKLIDEKLHRCYLQGDFNFLIMNRNMLILLFFDLMPEVVLSCFNKKCKYKGYSILIDNELQDFDFKLLI
jgi:antirestriction protein